MSPEQEKLRRAVYDFFMETGTPARVEDIAKVLKKSTSTVYRMIDGCHANIPDVDCHQGISWSRNHRRALQYLPSRHFLRKTIIELRESMKVIVETTDYPNG